MLHLDLKRHTYFNVIVYYVMFTRIECPGVFVRQVE